MRGGSPSSSSLKALAIGYLSRREYSRVELRTRLLAAAVKRVSKSMETQTRTEASADTNTDTESDTESATKTGAHSIEVDSLLDWLVAQGYLSDARFVESRLRTRAERHGLWRIRQELTQHGVELDPAQAAALRTTELARAQAVWERKFGVLATDARGRAAQGRFLAGRGFAADVVRRVVGGDTEE